MYEEGVLEKIKLMMHKDDPEDQLACAAILQNISEYRFCKGGMNPNQVKLVNDGILELLAMRTKAEDKRVQFLTCLSICNLAMNSENHKKIEKSGLLRVVHEFVKENQLHVDMVCHWLTLQPHVPLLQCAFYEVRLFSLSCLVTLSKNNHYKIEVWRTLSMNNGVSPLFALAKCPDPSISQLAALIVDTLQIEEPLVAPISCSDTEDYLSQMFNNAEFSDVRFVCQGETIYAHKAILCARSPLFLAMFTRFRESHQNVINIPDEAMDYDTLRVVLAYVYTNVPVGITRKNAIAVLAAAEMYGLVPLKNHCEWVLLQYLDVENAAEVFRVAQEHSATRLLRACTAFLARNLSRVRNSAGFAGLPDALKEEILEAVRKECVDSQGKKPEDKKDQDISSTCSTSAIT